MNKYMSAAAVLAASLILGACNSEPEVVGGTVDPQAEALKNAPPVQLPPAIRESKIYRCRDNSVVYVNILTDGNVNVRSVEDEPPSATLTRQSPDGPFTGNGFTLSGTGNTVNFTSPDVPSQSCRV